MSYFRLLAIGTIMFLFPLLTNGSEAQDRATELKKKLYKKVLENNSNDQYARLTTYDASKQNKSSKKSENVAYGVLGAIIVSFVIFMMITYHTKPKKETPHSIARQTVKRPSVNESLSASKIRELKKLLQDGFINEEQYKKAVSKVLKID